MGCTKLSVYNAGTDHRIREITVYDDGHVAIKDEFGTLLASIYSEAFRKYDDEEDGG
jgi:hypothetical protein